MMIDAAIKGLVPLLIQNGILLDAGFTDTGKKISTMKAKHPPRTASHKPAKKATTHGYVLNTARVRKKKRRDVNTTVATEKQTTSLSSMTHMELDDNFIAEEKSEIGYEIAIGKSELTCESCYHSRYSIPQTR